MDMLNQGALHMKRLVIVDDNAKIAKNICSILDWNSIGIEVVGSYTNAKDVLENIGTLKPDIVITDIVMPGIDGLKLAACLKNAIPDIKIIFMSCFDKFDYVKSAIFLDGEDYILKPVIKEDILKALGKAINKHDEEKKRLMEKNELEREKEEMRNELNLMLPLYQDEFIRELLFDAISSSDEIIRRSEYLKIDLHKKYVCVVSMELKKNGYLDDRSEIDDKYFTAYSIKKIISSYKNSNIIIHIVQLSKEKFCLLIILDEMVQNEESDPIVDILEEIKDGIYKRFKYTIAFGLSEKSAEICDIPKLYKQSLYALEALFFSDDYQITFYEDICRIKENLFEEKVNLQLLYKEMEEIIYFGGEEEIYSFIEKYFAPERGLYPENYVKSLVFSVVNNLQIILMKLNKSFNDIFGSERVIFDKMYRFQTINNVKLWTFNIIKAVRECLCSKDISHNRNLVNEIKDIITSRYNEQITINEMLREIYISPGHANVIFKKSTGKTIFDYLTDYRLEMAKKLLTDQHSKIYVVSKEVGYSNKSHFCLLFKKYSGLTPSEYKDRAVKIKMDVAQ